MRTRGSYVGARGMHVGTSPMRLSRRLHAASHPVHEPGPVTIIKSDGSTQVETPEQFRQSRNLAQCTRCFLWVPAINLAQGRFGHTCRWAPTARVQMDVFASGVDAWFEDRPASRRRNDDIIDPVEA